MELAKLTSKGQITIPKQIRTKLKLKEGDKVFFLEEKGRIYFQNASQIALMDLQKEMEGQAQKADFKSEEDVEDYIRQLRRERA
jgi:AbrB family looped-hinge helix DNA binding protein